MSHIQVDHNLDFQKLQEDGFEVEIIGTLAIIKNVPYFKDNTHSVCFGELVCNIDFSGGLIAPPRNHTMYFKGDYPTDENGRQMSSIVHSAKNKNLGSNILVNYFLSSRPKGTGKYSCYYDKISTYYRLISQPVKKVYPNYKVSKLKPIKSSSESVFQYFDTNSSRGEITALSEKFRGHKVGIIGLGGTGGYILDQVAKTPVDEIHLFDGDVFDQHNAFRAPGAASKEELSKFSSKVNYFSSKYSKMHKHIYPHNVYIISENLELLSKLDFVFVSIDKGSIKKIIFEHLESINIPFIDVGLGVDLVDESLIAQMRITSSFGNNRDHIYTKSRVSFSDDKDDEYSTNIQIADLNALNALFAVLKWKKFIGFYKYAKNEHHLSFSTHLNKIAHGDIFD